jgi:hypothetical protein
MTFDRLKFATWFRGVGLQKSKCGDKNRWPSKMLNIIQNSIANAAQGAFERVNGSVPSIPSGVWKNSNSVRGNNKVFDTATVKERMRPVWDRAAYRKRSQHMQ